jgi:hypothetical protein
MVLRPARAAAPPSAGEAEPPTAPDVTADAGAMEPTLPIPEPGPIANAARGATDVPSGESVFPPLAVRRGTLGICMDEDGTGLANPLAGPAPELEPDAATRCARALRLSALPPGAGPRALARLLGLWAALRPGRGDAGFAEDPTDVKLPLPVPPGPMGTPWYTDGLFCMYRHSAWRRLLSRDGVRICAPATDEKGCSAEETDCAGAVLDAPPVALDLGAGARLAEAAPAVLLPPLPPLPPPLLLAVLEALIPAKENDEAAAATGAGVPTGGDEEMATPPALTGPPQRTKAPSTGTAARCGIGGGEGSGTSRFGPIAAPLDELGEPADGVDDEDEDEAADEGDGGSPAGPTNGHVMGMAP